MYPFIQFDHSEYKSEAEMQSSALVFYQHMNKRRSVRDFSDRPVSQELIEKIILTAATAPSGAHKQPWTFYAISDKNLKHEIRIAAEKEEQENYNGRMSAEWLRDLAPLGTDDIKDFLDKAPWLIIVFKKSYDLIHGEKRKNYYVSESVGIACGFLLAAIHNAGLVALTHTPSPMNFLKQILKRPENETPYLLIPVGYPAEKAMVPDIKRKGLDEISVFK